MAARTTVNVPEGTPPRSTRIITCANHKPTVSLVVTYVVVDTYGCDDGRIWPTRCAVIDAALGGRYSPRPACSKPPARAGSARNALAVESGLASTVDLGASRRSRTTPPSGTMSCGDASLPRCAPGTRPCPPRLC